MTTLPVEPEGTRRRPNGPVLNGTTPQQCNGYPRTNRPGHDLQPGINVPGGRSAHQPAARGPACHNRPEHPPLGGCPSGGGPPPAPRLAPVRVPPPGGGGTGSGRLLVISYPLILDVLLPVVSPVLADPSHLRSAGKGTTGQRVAAPSILESSRLFGVARRPLPPSRRGAPGPCGFESTPSTHGSHVAQLCGTMCVSAIGVLPDAGWGCPVGRSPCRTRGATVRDGWRCRACRRCDACASRVSSPRCPFVRQSPGRCIHGR